MEADHEIKVASMKGAKSQVPQAPSEKRNSSCVPSCFSVAINLIIVGSGHPAQWAQGLGVGPILLQLAAMIETPLANQRIGAPQHFTLGDRAIQKCTLTPVFAFSHRGVIDSDRCCGSQPGRQAVQAPGWQCAAPTRRSANTRSRGMPARA